jgi:hypothetical protein
MSHATRNININRGVKQLACEVGITTRPQERKQEWRIKCHAMHDWTVIGPYSTRQAAQDWAERHTECEVHGGGDEPDLPGAQR